MTLPSQFTQENTENIFIYHYVEEMIANYGRYLKEELEETDIKRSEIPFLIRIRFKGKTTQKELVELFKVSEGYTAKLLRKFEDNGYITRCEDPSNRRKKIVELTDKGMEKTDELFEFIGNWEKNVTSKMTDEEVKLLKRLLFKVVEP
ncbi:MAG: winged helix-turn-helix transcriptional regulator [Methanobrevibacter thaueri]|jgi:DNA-binding MarR family transcriptional regulator|uniref:MarR family winged helix-turn-helix transcriptional regulator n=1 Tax=Methanobrevibacter thaueri TaxID=190975 RepID=UPI0026EB81E6|nr:MarR family winged helix-turn-helix transcriptional regulator [Methanobrevibacter thaueri]MBE6494891.1 winged helix-turn-helix transcriptional regulator [Methanobrevibacter thaueri]